MDASFGARLRARREGRQIPLAAIADQTKIKLSLLEGLERDDVSHWPSGIFRRSYIRAYAQAIGLDGDVVLREFLGLFPDPAEGGDALAALAGGRDAGSRRPPTRLRFLLGSAIDSLPSRRVHAEPSGHASPEPLPEPAVFAQRTPAPPVARHAVPSTVPDTRVSPVELSTLARLCTRLACVVDSRDLGPLFEEAAGLLDAGGVVLWLWDAHGRVLRPVFAHGYSPDLLAQLPCVSRDSDAAIAASFRSVGMTVVEGNVFETGALVVPLTTPAGCAGVLAIEFRDGGERHPSTHACATILAAQLSTLVGYPPLAQAATA
jgi:transcriptional regulator with XRE-family HTH domain